MQCHWIHRSDWIGLLSSLWSETLKYMAPVVIMGWSCRNALDAFRQPGSKRIYIASDLAGLPNLRHTAMVGREAFFALI